MTVAEIKEKINKAILNSAGERKTTAVRYLLSVLHTIKSMLDELEDKTDNTTEWIKLTTHGMIRFQCKKCDSIFSLPWEHCPKCGRKVTNNIKTNVHKYNYETGKLEKLK